MRSKRIKKRKMVWVFVGLGVVCMAGLGMYWRGTTLPVAHVASVFKTIDASPEQVWEALVDIEAMPTWRKELKAVERTEGKGGLPRWIEKSSFGDIPFQVEVMEKPSKLVTRIDDKSLAFGGTWTWILKPEGSQTEVEITENGEIYSPMFRFLSKYVFGQTKTLRTYADQLAARFQKEAK